MDGRVNRQGEQIDYALMIIGAVTITLYVTSNLMAVKLVEIGGTCWGDGGTVTFPLVYMLAGVVTERWGVKIASRLVWLAFVCNLIVIACTSVGILLPTPEYQAETAAAYRHIFSIVPRIVIASLVAFVGGEMLNIHVMSRIRKITGKRLLWVRTIGSSCVGYAVDSIAFVLLAFGGVAAGKDLAVMAAMQFAMKIFMEIVMATPAAYALIHLLAKIAPKGE
ncbi:MAG: queuosine precursor transporter [Victivallales bacterium]|nr:queuosine precursor transporter [Victivallales bacterium]